MKVYEEAVKKLEYVYCGNMTGGRAGNDTHCPSCGQLLVSRRGYSTRMENVIMEEEKAVCGKCGHILNIIAG